MPKKMKSLASVGLGFCTRDGRGCGSEGTASSPAVVDRRRIELADPAIRGSLQPFHVATELDPAAAEELIKQRADSRNALALQSSRRLIDNLCQLGYQAIGSSILVGSGRSLGTLESILASHAMIHTTEGEFFRAAIRRANETCGLPVTGIEGARNTEPCGRRAWPPPSKKSRAERTGAANWSSVANRMRNSQPWQAGSYWLQHSNC
jgi:hypothetical protein